MLQNRKSTEINYTKKKQLVEQQRELIFNAVNC